MSGEMCTRSFTDDDHDVNDEGTT